MKNLIIEKTNYIPNINLNATNGIFSINGRSYPENTFEVYKPINEWIVNYFKTTLNKKTIINLQLTYLNSSSLKAYFDMFDIFETAHEKGKNIEINWIYEADDDIIKETGEDFKEDFEKLKINLISIN